MKIQPSRRIASLSGYAFAEVDAKVAELKSRGIRPIDFGVGDPTDPTPPLIRAELKRAVDERAASGYPSYIGSPEFRRAVCDWTKRRFGVALDPDREVSSTIGAKEAVFNFAEAFVDPGDVVLVPSPGYPPAIRGALFAEGVPHVMPLRPERGFLPDLAAIPADVVRRAKLLWINYPNNPTGALAPESFFREAVEFARQHGLILCSDEAYTEIWFGESPPPSALQFARDGVVAFQSLSKRSAMTGWRVGWIAGDERIVSLFKKLKTNIDSGTPTFIQDAAVAALADERHVEEARARYRTKRDVMVEGLARAGLPRCVPQATLYLWQRVPDGMTSADFALRLLDPAVAVVATPGSLIAEPAADGTNPGEGFVRFALVPSLEECEEAARRIARALA